MHNNAFALIFWYFSQVTDVDIVKEAKPGFYRKYILPILHLNGVVHFVGFGNRLASDPIPFELQVTLLLFFFLYFGGLLFLKFLSLYLFIKNYLSISYCPFNTPPSTLLPNLRTSSRDFDADATFMR